MVQRTGSRPAKKVRHAKKDNFSGKKARIAAAKSQLRGKAEYADNESRSVEVKAGTKPDQPRSGSAAKTKLARSNGASPEVKAAVKGKLTFPRPGGEPKSAPHASKPPASKSKMENKERASVKVKGAKGKSTLSRPSGETKSAPHASKPAASPVTSKAENKERASVKKKGAKGKSSLSRPSGETKSAPHAGKPGTSKPKAENHERASVKMKGVMGKSALSRPGRATEAAQPAAKPAKSRAPAKAKREKKESASLEAMEAKAEARVSRPRGKARRTPRYLAAELGQPVDREGEPIGASSALLDSDTDLQAYALRLWRQMQSGGGVRGYVRAIERAGLTVDEVWTVGITDIQTTSSPPDELRRYQQKLLFRANLLEAILSETVAELRRFPGIEPTPSSSESVP